jgi:hypothetical protein
MDIITWGVHDAYVTLDISLVISRPFFPVARVVQQGHTAHFKSEETLQDSGWGLYLNVNQGNLDAQTYIPFVRAENIDGVSGRKSFVPFKPLVRVRNMRFDIFNINIDEDTKKSWQNGVFALDEQIETTPENADWLSSKEAEGSLTKGLVTSKKSWQNEQKHTHSRQHTTLFLMRHADAAKQLHHSMGHRSVYCDTSYNGKSITRQWLLSCRHRC